jgi:putative SOS response-associated peptidase YedK
MAKLLKDLGLPGLPQGSLELESLDIRPSMQVTTISQKNKQPEQSTMTWGIKPSWSKKLIINAQSETAAQKKTFA